MREGTACGTVAIAKLLKHEGLSEKGGWRFFQENQPPLLCFDYSEFVKNDQSI
jgi:hypothetical protein